MRSKQLNGSTVVGNTASTAANICPSVTNRVPTLREEEIGEGVMREGKATLTGVGVRMGTCWCAAWRLRSEERRPCAHAA